MRGFDWVSGMAGIVKVVNLLAGMTTTCLGALEGLVDSEFWLVVFVRTDLGP